MKLFFFESCFKNVFMSQIQYFERVPGIITSYLHPGVILRLGEMNPCCVESVLEQMRQKDAFQGDSWQSTQHYTKLLVKGIFILPVLSYKILNVSAEPIHYISPYFFLYKLTRIPKVSKVPTKSTKGSSTTQSFKGSFTENYVIFYQPQKSI